MSWSLRSNIIPPVSKILMTDRWLPAGADSGHVRLIDHPRGGGRGGPQNQFGHTRVNGLAKLLQIFKSPLDAAD